ncbi:MAG TPA: HlyD family efflux transporter periplasmic adaptor subunit [Gammaproteobacteria bacterium]|nr:HlyD family efflux transporter periplasmic adaptor subunit [Gammaproteobacteria bacterium]
MDIPRPGNLRKKRIRQAAIGIVAAVVLAAVTVGLTRLKPAAPSVAGSSLYIDTVHRGQMLFDVRGPGTLQPRETRWITAQTDARVERIIVLPGAEVKADTVIVEMSNADLVQKAEDARLALGAAKADMAEKKLDLQGKQLDEQAKIAEVESEYKGAKLEVDAQKSLADEGIVPALDYKRAVFKAEQLKINLQIEQQRLVQLKSQVDAQLASQKAKVDQADSAYQRLVEQVDSLKLRAGYAGVLQQMLVEPGQRIAMGANIASVARPDDLKAELQIPETQARDVQIGQAVSVDTRNGIVDGRVERIDPSVQGGTVQVDVELIGKLPRGARPDLSVDGTIQIEKLEDVVYTGRPALAQRNTTISLFKLVEGGDYAVQVPVQLGLTSVNTVQIIKGLEPGDRVILSDTSAWDDDDRIRIDK